MPESILANEISHIVENGLKNKHIVIWYDKGETLSGIIDETVPDGIHFIRYTGSYLAIRQEVEESDSHLKQKWFIYIGRKRKENSWLRDYELFGECIQNNLERLLVERLGLKSTSETKKLLAGDKGRLLAENWNAVIGTSKNDVTIELIKNGLLAVTFKLTPEFEIKRAILDYLTLHERLVNELSSMDLHELFNDKIIEYLGINCLNDGIVDPETLASALLLSEFVESSAGESESEFSAIIPPKEKRSYAVNLVNEWINNTGLIDGFFEWSERISDKYNIKDKLHDLQKFVGVVSFKVVEEILLDELIIRIKGSSFEENVEIALKISETRRKFIWSTKGNITYWNKIYLASKLFNLILTNNETFDEIYSFNEYIQKYTAENGWWKIDDVYLEMAACSENTPSEIIKYINEPTSKKYVEWLNTVSIKFSESVSRLDKWESKIAYSQQNFWMENVSVDDSKVAVIYIDALRYDLAKKLYSNLEKRKFKVSMRAMLSSLPSITEVGMSALLPKNEGLSLEVDDGKLKSLIHDSPVHSKSLRKDWISKVLDDVIFIDLKEINHSTKEDLQNKIQNFSRIIIMDQEIDKLGTFIIDITVSFFEALVDKIASAVENLHNAGIKKVIIGTDHGFLLLPKENLIDSIPVPEMNNETVKGRRFIIGHPPLNDKFIRFDYSSLGYNSEGVAEFPRGLYSISKRGTTGIIHGGISLQENCIASIESVKEVQTEKIGIKVEIPKTINSAFFFVKLIPKYKTVSFTSRKVKIQILIDDNLLEESEEHTIFQEIIKDRLVLRESPKEVEILVKDTETDEILFCSIVPVKLEGYDDMGLL